MAIEGKRNRVLILCDQELDRGKINAVGLRILNFARSLSAVCRVTLATAKPVEREEAAFQIATCLSKKNLKMLLAECDVVVCEGIPFNSLGVIVRSGKRVVLDAYAPNFEVLERFPGLSVPLTELMNRRANAWTKSLFWAADLVLSPNEKEADFLLGFMYAMGKVDARLHSQEPAVRSLMRVVPFGMPSDPPKHTRNVLKGVLRGVNSDDFVLLWNSGIYGWLDATTLIRAMHLLQTSQPKIKLVFLGVGDISEEGKGIPEKYRASRAREALAASKELGVLDKNVFFLFDRVPAEDVQNFLLEADAGVATYPDSLETRLCIGTRLFDFVWAELPIVTNSAPLLDEFVLRNRIGLGAKCGDPAALASAIKTLASDHSLYEQCKQGLRAVAASMTSESLAKPLVDYCGNIDAIPRPRHGTTLNYTVARAQFLYYTALIKARTFWEERHGRA